MRMRNWITHRVNPLHIYCRLVDAGLNRQLARKFSNWLESFIINKKTDSHGMTIAGYNGCHYQMHY